MSIIADTGWRDDGTSRPLRGYLSQTRVVKADTTASAVDRWGTWQARHWHGQKFSWCWITGNKVEFRRVVDSGG